MAQIKVVFDGEKFCILKRVGNTQVYCCVKCWKARSGHLDVNGKTKKSKTEQKKKNIGPIPEGKYKIGVEKIEKAYETRGNNKGKLKTGLRQQPWMKNLKAWGDRRVSIIPKPRTKTHGRDGFFLHGGAVFGSSGCIDLNCGSKDFFDYWEANYDKKGVQDPPIELIVDYSGKSTPEDCCEPPSPPCPGPRFSMVPADKDPYGVYASFYTPTDGTIIKQGDDLEIIAVGWAKEEIVDILIEYKPCSSDCYTKLVYHYEQNPRDSVKVTLQTQSLFADRYDLRVTGYSKSGEIDTDCIRFLIEPVNSDIDNDIIPKH